MRKWFCCVSDQNSPSPSQNRSTRNSRHYKDLNNQPINGGIPISTTLYQQAVDVSSSNDHHFITSLILQDNTALNGHRTTCLPLFVPVHQEIYEQSCDSVSVPLSEQIISAVASTSAEHAQDPSSGIQNVDESSDAHQGSLSIDGIDGPTFDFYGAGNVDLQKPLPDLSCDTNVLPSRPISLLVEEAFPQRRTSNDLLTPEILEDPEALARLGYGYPEGFGPPYPPLPLSVVLSLACRQDCVTSPYDLEVQEICDSPSSNTSGFCSGSLQGMVEGKECRSAAQSASSSEEDDRTVIPLEIDPLGFLDFSYNSCKFPVELEDVPKLFQMDSCMGDKDNGDYCSDFNCLRVMFSALRILYYGDLKTLIPVVRHVDATSETVADFILTRATMGLTAEEMISAAQKVSEDRVFGRFFPTNPRSKNLLDIELDQFLAFWIARGAVPIVCLNMHPGDEWLVNGHVDNGSWQYRVVYSADQGRLKVMTSGLNMHDSVSVQTMWQCLETPRTQIIYPDVLFLDDLPHEESQREPGDMASLRFLDDSLNVLGQVSYFLEIQKANALARIASNPLFRDDGRGGPPRPPPPKLEPRLNVISLPTRLRPGILLFARADNAALCQMIKAF